MRRADRLFQLVQLLRSRRFATAEGLAVELGVSKRTVYRDISDLQGSGVPIQGEAGVGYRMKRGYDLPPLTFNSEEIEALVMGMRVVQTWGDKDLADAARSALTKVEAVIPDPLRQVLVDTAIYVPSGHWASRSAEGVGLLRKAVAGRKRVRFEYERDDGETSTRTVRPLGLYFWGRTWSLAAWCELREAYRSFRPDRMDELELLDVFDDTETNLENFVRARQRE